MLAGPGTIATAMTFAAGGWLHIAISLASFTVICGATYCCFHYSDRLVGIPWAEWHECGDAFDGVDRCLDRGEHVAHRSRLSRSGRRLIRIGSRLVLRPIF